jgi:hypothetical protein
MMKTENELKAEHDDNSEVRDSGEARVRRKPGPVPGPPTRKYNLLLDEELGEWGKRQPGGLSELVRQLLTEEKKRRARTG